MTIIPGPDARAYSDVVIGPQKKKVVSVSVPDLSHLNGLNIGMSMRSRRAIGGLDGTNHGAQTVAGAFREGASTAQVLLKNHAAREHAVPEGAGVFAVYGHRGTDYLSGRSLERLIDSGTIGIGGEPGKDWKFWTPDGDREARGVELRINPDSLTTIAPDPTGDAPITMISDGHSNEFRPDVDRFHVPLNGHDRNDPSLFCVAQTTASLRLPSDKIGFIDRRIPNNRPHGIAVLLYGANTDDWPIRVETVGPPLEKLIVRFANSESI